MFTVSRVNCVTLYTAKPADQSSFPSPRMQSQMLGSQCMRKAQFAFKPASSGRACLLNRRSIGQYQRSRRLATVTMSKTVLVPLGNGSEEMEAVTIIDVLRRAGAEVTVASVEVDLTVECSRQVKIVADKLIKDVAEAAFDIIVLPVRTRHWLCSGKAAELGSCISLSRASTYASWQPSHYRLLSEHT